ncbi:MAG: flippase [Coleofasciculus sp. G3-WIS-01]|uniref:flippase n=1 Tax=Coleofasciculus sp. G3-WIS-01 TaxID=3069528 RepID=UPI0032F61944
MLDKIASFTQKLSPGLRQVLSNIGWLVCDKFLELGLSLVVGVWVTRYLGPSQFGLLTYATTFVGMFRFASLQALQNIVVRDMARTPTSKNETLGTTFILQLAGGLITLLAAVGTIYWLQPSETLTHWLVGIIAAATLFNAFNTIDFWFQSQVQSKYTVVAKRFAYVFMVVIRIGLIQLQAPLIAFAWARLAEMVLGSIGLVIAYQSQGNYIQAWRASWKRAKELLKEGWLLIAAGIGVYIYADIDQLMLGSMLPDKSELGFYAATTKISRLLDLFPMVLASSILPKLTALKEKSQEDYLDKIQVYFDLSTLIWLAGAIPVSLLSHYIVQIIYGSDFAASGTLLSVYVWSQFNSCFGVARSTILTIERKLKFNLILTIIGAIVNLILNYILIPSYGAMGATVATIITYLIVIILINFFIEELRFIGTLIIRSFNLYTAISRLRKNLL